MAQKKSAKNTTTKASKAKTAGRTAATKVSSRARQTTSGFLEFIRSQGVVGLAIGLVIGTQVKLLVDQLVKSFIDPTLGLFLGTGKGLSSKVYVMTIDSRQAALGWGAFLYVLIDFLLVALVIYLIIKWLKLDKLDLKK